MNANPQATNLPGIQPGTVILGKYQVERQLGQGGMGVVLAARHLVLEERVAIKCLLPQVAAKPDLVRRFLREAQAAVKIRSEHVTRVLDVGTMETGQPYIVMEYLSGADLSELLEKKGPMPLEQAVEFILQTCEGLADAHSIGIVHRDIKPANLFVTMRPDGSPLLKILDFGISKINDNQALTQTRGMMGSPLYMSPEQLNSAKDVDARVDVYALGVVLFELLTARQPFEADELPQLIVQILNAEPASVRSFRPEIPEAIDAIIRQCLVKDRNQRFQSVAALAQALAAFGPSRAALSADRAARITASRATSWSAPPPPIAASTFTPLGGTKPPAPSGARVPAIIGACALLLFGGIGFGAMQYMRAQKPDVASTPANATEKPAHEKTAKAQPPAKDETEKTEKTEKKEEPAPPSTAAAPTVPAAPKAPPPAAPTIKPVPTTKPAEPKASVAAPKPSAKPPGNNDDPFGSHVY